MRGKAIHIVILAFLLVVPLALLFSGGAELPAVEEILSHRWQSRLEQRLSERLPFSAQFEQLRLRLLLAGGQNEQNGVFITDVGLIRRVEEAEPDVAEGNTKTLLEFSDAAFSWDTPVFVSLLPTASAILREHLPRFSNVADERRLIDSVYTGLSGHVSTIDVYRQLIGQRGQYIYYRTEDNFTSLGGYYLYTQMLPRMLNTDTPKLSAFNLSYPKHDYYGDLYRLFPYGEVTPDTLTLFHYKPFAREYLVTQTARGERKTYHTLFPEHLISFGREMDLFLGGLSAQTDIRSSAPYARSLLILGDKTALAYTPFLANHYGRVTILDLFREDVVTSGIHIGNYSHVLVAYSVDTYMTKRIPPELLGRLVAEE